MKKLIGLLMFVSGVACAEPASVSRSSYIAGSNQNGCIQATYVSRVLVGAATTGGSITLHNSSWTQTSTVLSSVTLSVGNDKDFDNAQVNGICYKASTPTNGVTIIYKK